MSNKDKLRSLLADVLLLSDGEFRFDLRRTDVDTWDSLAVVSIAVGVDEVFRYHMPPEEAASVQSVADLMAILEREGVKF